MILSISNQTIINHYQPSLTTIINQNIHPFFSPKLGHPGHPGHAGPTTSRLRRHESVPPATLRRLLRCRRPREPRELRRALGRPEAEGSEKRRSGHNEVITIANS